MGLESVASSSLAVAVGDGSSVGGSECLVVEVGECSGLGGGTCCGSFMAEGLEGVIGLSIVKEQKNVPTQALNLFTSVKVLLDCEIVEGLA